MTEKPSDYARCPHCRSGLDAEFVCTACKRPYPLIASIRILLQEPVSHVEHWRRQLGLIVHQGSQTRAALVAQAAEPGIGPATQTRLDALGRAIVEQLDDIALVLSPALGGPLLPVESTELPRGATDYISYLHRDWGWSDGHDPEHEESLAAIRRVTEGQDLGRVLVLGAGACRLSYDLHVHCGASRTTVVDVDPFLLVIAEAVIRGALVNLTESSVNAPEVAPVSRRWTLSAPSGPLGTDAFHFFLADGTDPPFVDQAFDTIVTPWFIDQVPTDLAGLLKRLHGLLAPNGRWINQGPLLYRPNMLPIARWYTRQEIFDLASSVGFRIGAWERASHAYLVSPLTGRGLIENILTFEAVRT